MTSLPHLSLQRRLRQERRQQSGAIHSPLAREWNGQLNIHNYKTLHPPPSPALPSSGVMNAMGSEQVDELVVLVSHRLILSPLFFQLHLQLARQLCPLVHLLRIFKT
jgi:hypothetical protein